MSAAAAQNTYLTLLSELGIDIPPEEWADCHPPSDPEPLTTPRLPCRPAGWDGELPVFTSSQVAWCDPDHYGFHRYEVVEDDEAAHPLALSYADERYYAANHRPVHRYSRPYRLRWTLCHVIGHLGKFPGILEGWLRDRLETSGRPEVIGTRNAYEWVRTQLRSPAARSRFGRGWPQRMYRSIPLIVRELGGPRWTVTPDQFAAVVEDALQLHRTFDALRRADKLGRQRFPKMQYVLLRLLDRHGVAPPYRVLWARTCIKRRQLGRLLHRLQDVGALPHLVEGRIDERESDSDMGTETDPEPEPASARTLAKRARAPSPGLLPRQPKKPRTDAAEPGDRDSRFRPEPAADSEHAPVPTGVAPGPVGPTAAPAAEPDGGEEGRDPDLPTPGPAARLARPQEHLAAVLAHCRAHSDRGAVRLTAEQYHDSRRLAGHANGGGMHLYARYDPESGRDRRFWASAVYALARRAETEQRHVNGCTGFAPGMGFLGRVLGRCGCPVRVTSSRYVWLVNPPDVAVEHEGRELRNGTEHDGNGKGKGSE